MLRLLLLTAILQCSTSQQQQQNAPPGVPPQNYQYQQQQYQQVPAQQQQVPAQQQVPVQQQQAPVQEGGHNHAHQPSGDQLLNPANIADEREHIQEHMEVPLDTSNMTEQELQFHYFKMHDADNNNKLDGCELIKSLIHWHDSKDLVKIYTDEEIEWLIKRLLKKNDFDDDGYVSYVEYKLGEGFVLNEDDMKDD